MPLQRNTIKDTMEVIVDGKVEVRFVSHYEEVHARILRMSPIPELRDDEKLVWIVGESRPTIIKTR